MENSSLQWNIIELCFLFECSGEVELDWSTWAAVLASSTIMMAWTTTCLALSMILCWTSASSQVAATPRTASVKSWSNQFALNSFERFLKAFQSFSVIFLELYCDFQWFGRILIDFEGFFRDFIEIWE